ncbi:uncharacterized protein LOC113202287 isoform X2 [Frankliniella occidentalis]|uniref:Uncharacterized protein LOC113202287 isoform X2 n=1 Tax=Frankliniella occidentalis TaxID=133901 RepID=A0A6J1RTI1_FRAOC|nr:uncharacterized protein LOC113202287 isoform X2 [Frankliniella occidentalis]
MSGLVTNNNNDEQRHGEHGLRAAKGAAAAMALAGDAPDEEIEYPSLEYEEDVYYSHRPHATPSFDLVEGEDGEDGGDPEVGIPSSVATSSALAARLLGDEELDDADVDQCLALAAMHGLDLDDLDVTVDVDMDADVGVDTDVGAYSVETEFVRPARGLLGLISKKRRRPLVRVTFQDLTKPYFSKISSASNYRRFLQLVREEPSTDMLSPDSGVSELQGLTPEEAEKQKEEWRNQLAELENEIQIMRSVLASKVKQSQDLKRKLGFSVWRELTDDVSQGLRNVKESNVSMRGLLGSGYQKTESVVKATAEKTTSILGGLGSGITMKLGQLKNSESFRSLEEKVGSAYENVKTKVSTSRSSSMQSFDEALRETEYKKGSTATTPTIPEDRPIS